jgi:hypothetical protein
MQNAKEIKDIKGYIENNTLRIEASRRGGGIEIDVSDIFEEGCKMTAYQNYLGGGLLGSIGSDYNFKNIELTADKDEELKYMQEVLKRYFHYITNEEAGEYDEWNSSSFESVQKRSESAY